MCGYQMGFADMRIYHVDSLESGTALGFDTGSEPVCLNRCSAIKNASNCAARSSNRCTNKRQGQLLYSWLNDQVAHM